MIFFQRSQRYCCQYVFLYGIPKHHKNRGPRQSGTALYYYGLKNVSEDYLIINSLALLMADHAGCLPLRGCIWRTLRLLELGEKNIHREISLSSA